LRSSYASWLSRMRVHTGQMRKIAAQITPGQMD
jgi:hypothetical protein